MRSRPLPAPIVLARGRVLEFGQPTIMGVVNVTPDSFSDGGQYLGVAAAVSHGLTLEAAGANVLDIGGESTRPGSLPVSSEAQIARVIPVIRGIREQSDVAISIDTTDAAVAAAALEAGADIVNDISAFRFDHEMLGVIAKTKCAAIAMHTLDAPKTMQEAPAYDDVVAEVAAHLRERVDVAVAAGVERRRLLVDPGIGFGKLLRHNLELLRGLSSLHSMGLGVVVGTSRKRFLGEVTGRPVEERDPASAAAAAIAPAA